MELEKIHELYVHHLSYHPVSVTLVCIHYVYNTYTIIEINMHFCYNNG
jgi:hypothetical protein